LAVKRITRSNWLDLLGIQVLGTVFAVTCVVAGKAAADCPKAAVPELRLENVHEEVRQDPDIGIAELQRLAGAVGERVHPLIGMSISRAGYAVRVDTAVAPYDGGFFCVYAVRVDVRLGVVDRALRVAREVRGDACLHALALEHQRLHFQAEVEALDEVAPDIVERVRAALDRLGAVRRASDTEARQAMQTHVAAIVGRATQVLHEVMMRAKEVVDSPVELARLRKACGGRALTISNAPF